MCYEVHKFHRKVHCSIIAIRLSPFSSNNDWVATDMGNQENSGKLISQRLISLVIVGMFR